MVTHVYALWIQGVVHTPVPGSAAFDPKGLVFAVGYGSNTIKLFDVRQLERVGEGQDGGKDCARRRTANLVGVVIPLVVRRALLRLLSFLRDRPPSLVGTNSPANVFLSFYASPKLMFLCTDVKFNNNNRNILIRTSSGVLFLIEAFNGSMLHVLGSQRLSTGAGLFFSGQFSKESKFLH